MNNLLSLSLLILGITLIAGCGSYKMPTEEDLKEKNYKPVHGLIDVSEVREKPDEMPMYPGGNGGLIKDIQTNLDYPKEALRDGVSGTVIVAFTLNEKGQVKDVTVDKSVDPRLDEEAIAVMGQLQPWYPAQTDGKAVSINLKTLVSFRGPKLDAPQQSIRE